MHAIPAAMQPFPFATMHEKGRAKIQKRVSLMQKSFDLNNAGLGSVRAGGHWFIPCKRSLPGNILPRQQELQSDDSTLTLVSDEGSDCRLSSIYLVSCGLRVRFERDFLHRLNNSHLNAISSAGYSDIQAKAIFLSRVNRTPYGSAVARNRKCEMFTQLHQIAKADNRILQEYERSYLFDQNQWLAETDSVVQSLLAVPSSVEQKTEGVACLKN